jgi:hypothetical protein
MVQTFGAKHAEHVIIVVDNPMERASVHQGCHNTSMIIMASKRGKSKTLVAWLGHGITSNQFHMINNVVKQSIAWEYESSM